ncbi:MAG TPA: glycosyltransferase [Terriglobales bacterium]|nr:glycosyltransferase [Terriglobales bacterium]
MEQHIALRILDYLNTLILIYFIVTNLGYTVLMAISLYSVTQHSKYARSRGYADLADSPVTPPVALIVPAYNEEAAIVDTVTALLNLNYPEKEIIVVDDGSSDRTVQVLVDAFQLVRMDLIYREQVPAKKPYAFYHNHRRPELTVISKENGGKPDALNVGINMARSPYFCTVDADSIIERDALLRLMAPVMHSSVNTVVSGGIVRIANGCKLKDGQIAEVGLPKSWLEMCQVVEYIRAFMFGRPAWNFLQATFIVSGAFCMLHKETVVLAGGFSTSTVTEDIDIIATLHRYLREKGWKYRMVFTSDPICWTEAPHTLAMFARQRRRWQLGLMQTVMKNHDMILNPRFGTLGMLSMPFHAYIEAMGCLIEAFGFWLIMPLSFILRSMPLGLFLLFLFLAVGYGTLLSMGSVLLEEATLRRYPKLSHVLKLMGYAVVENLGYRQIVAIFRAQGVLRFFAGMRRWEVVRHKGLEGGEGYTVAQHEA